MMLQSCQEYDPINYMKKPWGPPPPSSACSRCGKPGDCIKNCPTNGDKNVEPVPRIKEHRNSKEFHDGGERPQYKGCYADKHWKIRNTNY
ncbi:E3 ubiquitin-protein ligase RBBP6-like [Calonectris borealis]|uniref:E3 ubiquitin-protein ligase RBBP6-like n=1 Tax=Calonectris borealis TaxID=1323832 RepID=UPI003F4C31BD